MLTTKWVGSRELSFAAPSRVSSLQSSLRQKEAVLAEALTSHAAQLEMWRAEATEVAQAASKWKQRALVQQQQVRGEGLCRLSVSFGVRGHVPVLCAGACDDHHAPAWGLCSSLRCAEAQCSGVPVQNVGMHVHKLKGMTDACSVPAACLQRVIT